MIGHIAGYHCTRADHRSCADPHAGKNHRIGSDPHIDTDDDVGLVYRLGMDRATVVEAVIGRGDDCVGADDRIVAYRDPRRPGPRPQTGILA